MNVHNDKPDATLETEPTAGSTQTPVWLFVLIAMLSFWGMGFLDRHAGGFHPKVYEPFVSFKQVDDLQPKSEGDFFYFKGRDVYGRICVLCHQPTGMGEAGKAPPLVGSEWVLAPKPDRIVRIVLHGLQGPITVKGQEWNLAMFPWKGVISDAEIAAVVTFIRQNKDWGHNASAVTTEQVKAISDAENRAESWTVPDLLKIPEN